MSSAAWGWGGLAAMAALPTFVGTRSMGTHSTGAPLCREQGMGLKYRRRRDNLSYGDVVDQRRGLDGIKLYFLPLELSNRLFALGLNHRADNFIARLTDADAHFPFELRMKKTIEILRHHLFRYERRVVSKSDIGFSR